MGGLAVAMVVVAALFHALWNLQTKRSGDKLAFVWALSVAIVVLFAIPVAILMVRDMPSADALPFLAVSGVLETAYFVTLARAYSTNDMVLVYPVARGTGVLLVPLVAMPVFGIYPTPFAWAGIAAIVAGIVFLHAPAIERAGGWTRLKDVVSGPALLTGILIASYSLVDSAGVKHMNPLVYLYFIYIVIVVLLGIYVLPRKRAALRELLAHPRDLILAGIGNYATYALILGALLIAPVSYIGPTREISIVIGAWLGARVLREPFEGRQYAACGMVALGVITIGLFG